MEGACLAWLKTHPSESLQLDRANRLLAVGWRQVDLCHFVGCHSSCIFHVERKMDGACGGTCLLVHLQVGIVERTVTESVAECPFDAWVCFSRIVVTDRFVDFHIRIAHRELARWRDLSIEDVSQGVATFLAWIPSLNDGCTTRSDSGDDLGASAEHDEYDRLSRGDELVDKCLLSSRQIHRRTLTVLTAQQHVLTHRCHNHVAVGCQTERFGCISRFGMVDCAVEQFTHPFGTLVTTFLNPCLHRLGPVATACITQLYVLGLALLHAFLESHNLRVHVVFCFQFPEIAHGLESVVAQHRPHGVGIWTCEQQLFLALQWKDSFVLKQNHGLCGKFVGGLSFVGRVEHDFLLVVEFWILVEQTAACLVGEHTLHGFLQGLLCHDALVDGFL